MEPLFNQDYLLASAAQDYVLNGKEQFIFPVRRKGSDPDFYTRFEREIRAQKIFKVNSYRTIKEGYARVSRPASLLLELDTLLVLQPHLRLLRRELESLHAQFKLVNVKGFARANAREVLANIVLFRSCLEVMQYLLDHLPEVLGLLPRQIAHGQSSKLIGKEALLLKLFSAFRGELARWRDFYAYFGLLDRPAEFRFFAPVCTCQGHMLKSYHGLLAREWADGYSFAGLKGTLIVENFDSFLASAAESRESLIIWGGGWKAVQLAALFSKLPRPIFYWGDLDKEGYEIFGYLKNLCREIEPVLMDKQIVQKYEKLHQQKEVFLGPFRLVHGLQEVYEFVCRKGIQIEQEQIHEAWPYGSSLV